MKTLILFKSKFGATEQYARWIAEDIPGAEVYDLERFDHKKLADYNTVVIGLRTSFGKLNRLGFLNANWPVLKDKRVFVFTCGLQPADTTESRETYLLIPPEIRARVKYAKFPGVINLDRMNFFEKLLGRAMKSADPGPPDRKAVRVITDWATLD